MAQFAAQTKAPAMKPRTGALVPPQVQAKLEVGPAGDQFEQEADQVAAAVMQTAAPATIPPTITPLGAQRKAAPAAPAASAKREEEKKAPSSKAKTAQRKAAPAAPAKREEKKAPAGKGKPVQRKAAAAPSAKREEKKAPAGKGKTAQREAVAGAAGGAAPDSVDSAIQSMRAGPAAGLDGGTRSFMEGQFGRDFGDVRVHHGSEAANAADAIGAQAFTTGNDIFFNSGQYQPGSKSGRQLIAHELTHTVQQSGSSGTAARKRIQRKAPDPPKAADPDAPKPTTFVSKVLKGAMLETAGYPPHAGRVTLPQLRLPRVAESLKGTTGKKCKPMPGENRSLPVEGETPFDLAPVGARDENSKAYIEWTKYVRETKKAGIQDVIQGKVDKATGAASIVENGQKVFYLTFASKTKADLANIFIGTVPELAVHEGIVRPQWNPSGESLMGFGNTLDADHMLELQLGGLDAATNMWLLKAEYNQRVGRKIKDSIYEDLGKLQKEVASESVVLDKKPKTAKEMKYDWLIHFLSVKQADFGATTNEYWTLDDIGTGKHIEKLKVMSEADLVTAGLKLEPGQRPTAIKIFPSAAGGRMTKVKLASDGVNIAGAGYLYPNMWAIRGTYNHSDSLDKAEGPLMKLRVLVNKVEGKGKEKKVVEQKEGDVDVLRSPRLGIAGYISRDSILKAVGQQEFPPLSPLTFSDIGISPEGELVGTGEVTSSKALLPRLPVPLVLRGDQIRMDFPIPTDGMNLGPVAITQLAMGLGVGAEGLFIDGFCAFELGSLGSGSVVGEVTKNGAMLSGTFDLSMDFLKPASLAMTYALATDTLTVKGTLGVEKGRIPGVDSGQVTVEMTREAVKVDGALTLGGPLKDIKLTVAYAKETGLKIGAENIQLPLSKYPAIKDATMSISATQKPEGGWSFAGSGTATLAVPGATGTIGISYLDGAITFTADAQVAKGPAAGTLTFTATNRVIDEAGKPVEGPPGDQINVWGKGSVTIAFGKILTGTAGVELTPDNRVIISGSIAMPPVFEVFPRKDYNKDLFTLKPPEFPIWGVSVAGYGIGIFAFAEARVFFTAFVGPGQIRNAQIGAVMDLDKPEDATLTGHAEFFVPAYAGLGADASGGLRARLAIAYAEGRVGITGTLGLDVSAAAAIDINWSRATGLSLGADLIAKASPKFDLSVYASVEVGVDLWIKKISKEFGPWRKKLGSFGPDMTLGVTMPVRWSEASGLDFDLDDIQVTKPSLDASALMTSVFDQIAP